MKMNKIALAAAVISMPLCLQTNVALADNDVGCGLGTQVWEGQSGLLPKILAATTNGLVGNQTFGITSGTLGCSRDGVVTAEARRPMFAAANLDQLAVEMAAGEGEALDNLATLYGVETSDREAFAAMTQQHYGEIFASEDVNAGQVLASIEALMASDTTLARYVA